MTNKKYDAFIVTPTGKKNEDGSKDDYWLQFSQAFVHEDGDGFTIPMDRLGRSGKIVVRLNKPRAVDPAQ